MRSMSLARLATSLTVLVVATSLAAGPAEAMTSPRHSHCAEVAASGTGQDLGDGHTQATLSVSGTPVATSEAAFTITSVTEEGIASFTGPIVLTPVKGPGTLTAEVAGMFDTGSGDFRATSTSLSGTGPLRKVTGRLTFDGLESLTSGSFTETVTGELCRRARAL